MREAGRPAPAQRARAQGRAPGAARDHRRRARSLLVRRPRRRAGRRADRQRRDPADPRRDGGLAGGGRRRRRGALGHDGRPRARDPRGARRGGLHRGRDRQLLHEVRLGVLRAVPRRARLRAAQRRQEDLPDGSRQRARGAARAGARRVGGRRLGDGEARPRLRRHHPAGARPHRAAGRRLSRERRVRDAARRRRARLARLRPLPAREPARR